MRNSQEIYTLRKITITENINSYGFISLFKYNWILLVKFQYSIFFFIHCSERRRGVHNKYSIA